LKTRRDVGARNDPCIFVSEVRAGLGLMGGIELAPEALGNGLSVAGVFHATRKRGVLVRPLGLSPPPIVGDEELAMIPEVIGEALDAVYAAAAKLAERAGGSSRADQAFRAEEQSLGLRKGTYAEMASAVKCAE
jgi:hypothetical protein